MRRNIPFYIGIAVVVFGFNPACGSDDGVTAPPTPDVDLDAGVEVDLDASLDPSQDEILSDVGLDEDVIADPIDSLDRIEEETLPEGEGVLLRIYTLDIWAQPLRGAELELILGSETLLTSEGPIAWLRLDQIGRYTLRLSAEHHHDLTLNFYYRGGRGSDSVRFYTDTLRDFHGITIGRSKQLISGVQQQVVTLFLGLRHRWFSATGPPVRYDNQVTLLMDGEEAWSTVFGRLQEATERIHIAVWSWYSDFELIRPIENHIFLSEDERRANTIISLLDESPATVRVMVWQDNLVPWATIDETLDQRGETAGDSFEFMGMTNSTEGVFWWEITPFYFSDRVSRWWPEGSTTNLDSEEPIHSEVRGREVDLTDYPMGIEVEVQIASWHQKFLVLDGQEAFVGGMNLRYTDWDTSEHLVFEPRRMLFDASTRQRLSVSWHEDLPEVEPRKDYMIHLVGPAVEDVEEVFHRRWLHLIETGREYSENASAFEVYRDPEPMPDGVPVQITTTMPEPFWEHSNLESMRNAIRNAEHYIYVEDQYWRAPLLTEVILERMEQVEDLVLIVVSKPMDEWFDPACEWTYRTDQAIRERFGDRYFLYQLRSFDYVETWGWDETESRFVDIDTHSKMLMVDDLFMSVGSCNKNNRGLIYEGEMNIAVLDEQVVTDARRRILSNLLGYSIDIDEPWEFVVELEEEARINGDVYDRWDDEGFDISLDGDPLPDKYQPFGFVYPLRYGDPDDCFLEGIGQDIMK